MILTLTYLVQCFELRIREKQWGFCFCGVQGPHLSLKISQTLWIALLLPVRGLLFAVEVGDRLSEQPI